MSMRSDYLAYIRAAYERERGHLADEIARWQEQFRASAAWNALFGYSPPRWPLHMAAVAAFLYEQTDGVSYAAEALAAEAAGLLLRFPEWTRLLPAEVVAARPEYAEGVPPLDTTFDPLVYGAAAARIRPALDPATYARLADIAADSLRPIYRFPEWGGHNRALLRAASLAICARAFPDHAEAAGWAELADELAEESWGRWSIEDAMMYQAHWLRALIQYAEARGQAEMLAEFVQPRLILRAACQLMSPLGLLPDFGDSQWQVLGRWEWLACLEWGATTYRDPAMKWAAARLWQFAEDAPPDLYGAQALLLAWRWCDDTVMPAAPRGPAHDALDDLVLKKIVFRTGWDGRASYALLNYRDEGPYGRVARDYLRTTLAVSAEKMHHGHADEGSISLLIHDGTVLLHESGYRESPPDGMYRADYYHNRLIWRPGLIPVGAGATALRDAGQYRPVTTERLYLTRLRDTEVSRVRVTDAAAGVTWDRSVFFLPDMPCWVVIDGAGVDSAAACTFGLLWWTTDVLARGPDWVDTHIASIQGWRNATSAALRIYTPAIPGQSFTRAEERDRRCFQEETLLSALWRGEHAAGAYVNFVTVLWPHAYALPADADAPMVEVVAGEPAGSGLAVRLTWQGRTRLLAARNDLAGGTVAEGVRPRYTYERGRVTYGPLATDAAFAVLTDDGRRTTDRWAGFINGTRLDVGGTTLYAGLPHAMFQEDRTDRPGVPARLRWTHLISRDGATDRNG